MVHMKNIAFLERFWKVDKGRRCGTVLPACTSVLAASTGIRPHSPIYTYADRDLSLARSAKPLDPDGDRKAASTCYHGDE